MNALLVRVGADRSSGGGSWNGPADASTGAFVYVPIPEGSAVHPGLEKPYSVLTPALATLGVTLPQHLRARYMHLDPDFDHLTYGDRGERGKQLRTNLSSGDMIVFYAGLADTGGKPELVYALIGIFVVASFVRATDVAHDHRDMNAHSRRVLKPDAEDVIVRGRPGVSGRFTHYIPIGEYRDRAYRVRKDILTEWGGISATDGYLQRSARLPRLLDAPRFAVWLEQRKPSLVQSNY